MPSPRVAGGSSYGPLADLAAKMRREETYHLLHFDLWLRRLAEAGGEARMSGWPRPSTACGPTRRPFSPRSPASDARRGRYPARAARDAARALARASHAAPGGRRPAGAGRGAPARPDGRTRRTDDFAWLYGEFTMVAGSRREPRGSRCPDADHGSRVWAALAEIADPEIPAISLVDLGVIGAVSFDGRAAGGERLTVELLPTFVGCPAIELMRSRSANG